MKKSLHTKIISTFMKTFWLLGLPLALLFFVYSKYSFDKSKQSTRIISIENLEQTFSSSAQFGDIRYTKFMLKPIAKSLGFSDFRVFDVEFNEIQKTPGSPKISIKDIIYGNHSIGKVASGSSLFQDGNNFVAKVNLVSGNYYYLFLNADNTNYPYTSILLILLCSLVMTIASYFISKSQINKIIKDIEKFSLELFSHNNSEQMRVPYSEFTELAKNSSHLLKELKLKQEQAVIAQTTQMLAHDVRKPFSLLKSGLTLLESASDEKKNDILNLVRSQVNHAIEDVSSMINDVMEIGNSSDVKLEVTFVEEVISESGSQIAAIFPDKKVLLEYDIQSSHLLCEPRKLVRVFSNILSNAVQASSDETVKLWIKTDQHPENSGRIRITLGNSGSYISDADKEKLFDSFFTKGKKDGTGLGLAIVKKVVEDHGGSISVHSSKLPAYTEFIFDIERSNVENITDRLKPELHKDLRGYSLSNTANSVSSSQETLNSKKNDLKIEQYLAEIKKYTDKIDTQSNTKEKNKLVLALLDDEMIYRSAIKTLIEESSIKDSIQILEFSNSDDILKSDMLGKVDYLVSDIDLKEDLSGYDVISKLKEMGYGFPVCIHSNNDLPEYHKKTEKIGAKAFIPKPMTPPELLTFISKNLPPGSNQRKDTEKTVKASPKVIVLDDESIYLKAWELSLGEETELRMYEDTSFLVGDVFNHAINLGDIDIIICDYYFRSDDVTSNKIGEFVRKHGFEGKLLLSTNGPKQDLPKGFNLQIPKDAIEWDQLMSLLK